MSTERKAWHCPSCNKYHAPHVDTCPGTVYATGPNTTFPYPGTTGNPPWHPATTGGVSTATGMVAPYDPTVCASLTCLPIVGH